MKNNNYTSQLEKAFSPLLATEEAARCLLCEDAPCSASCPAGTDPAKFIRSLRFRNEEGAIDTIRINNPLGGICARVCPTEKYCEKACSRCGIDRPINIGKLQQYLCDYQSMIKYTVYKDQIKLNGKKVAIIGSGPSGLTSACELALKGYEVTVYEKNKQLGGYLRYGIPSYRLSNEVVDQEIEYIKELGVKFETNREIKAEEITTKFNNSFDAVLLATGLQNGILLPLFEECKNVVTAIEYLKEIKENDGKIKTPESVLIIGGGDVAMDAALSSKKIGVKDIKVVARETFDIYPASKKELRFVQENNIDVFAGFNIDKVENNSVEFKSVTGTAILKAEAELIVLAVGQSFTDSLNLEKDSRKLIATTNYMTSIKAVFAAGDIVEGDKSVVFSVKLGKEAATAIDAYLGGK